MKRSKGKSESTTRDINEYHERMMREIWGSDDWADKLANHPCIFDGPDPNAPKQSMQEYVTHAHKRFWREIAAASDRLVGEQAAKAARSIRMRDIDTLIIRLETENQSEVQNERASNA